MGLYKSLIFPILSKYDPERVHYLAMYALDSFRKLPGSSFLLKKFFEYNSLKLEREVFGLKFKNPVGLAAGFDKNATWIDSLSCLGFGFIEIGTITPKGQDGNEKPRLFRLKSDSALLNRMGFNNYGANEAVKNLKSRNSNLLIGGNIGKNKLTSNEVAVSDYLDCFNALFDLVDYFVVNVSSPNTPGLRELQEKKPLTELLNALNSEQKERKRKPILLKIAPDLSNQQLDDIISIVQETKIDGLIATNTTISRDNLKVSENELEKLGPGGISGKPLKERSTEIIRYISEKSNKTIPIVGVGGIFSPKDAMEKLEAGASLVQIYSGFIYEGPGLVKKICKSINKNTNERTTL